jgi:RNA polymerase sigma factor (sigma-70 family)
MNSNPTDAEDALSRAMLKAWEKFRDFSDDIQSFKAWLTRLTYHLCIDIQRERNRGANRVENIEIYTSLEDHGQIFQSDTPESALEKDEKKLVICRAINNLPERLRETFILHFYAELSYPEIAQKQDISYDNVCKRISQARTMLREELKEYFFGQDKTDSNESLKKEKPKKTTRVQPIVGETVALPEVVEEVEIVVKEKSMDVKPSEQQKESATIAA